MLDKLIIIGTAASAVSATLRGVEALADFTEDRVWPWTRKTSGKAWRWVRGKNKDAIRAVKQKEAP